MKFTLEERLNIGREIYTRQLSIIEATIKYSINNYTARDYMRLYRDKNNLPPMNENDDLPSKKGKSFHWIMMI